MLELCFKSILCQSFVYNVIVVGTVCGVQFVCFTLREFSGVARLPEWGGGGGGTDEPKPRHFPGFSSLQGRKLIKVH